MELKIKIKGEDTSEALRNWIKSDIEECPTKQGYNLGKFFFSVSVGTIGALVAIEKWNKMPQIDCPMLLALILLFVSIIIALILAIPKPYFVGDETDLLEEYKKQVNKVGGYSWAWFSFWLVGTLIGGFAVRS